MRIVSLRSEILPKVIRVFPNFDPGQDRVLKVTISNVFPEVDLGYYLDSVSIYNATSGEQGYLRGLM